MKEFILIPKNMFEMLSKKKDNNITLTNTKINNKRKKEDLTRTIYFIEDLQGEPIKGIFYREEHSSNRITRNISN